MSGHFHNVDHLTDRDVFSFIKEELSLTARKKGDSVVFTLMLAGGKVGLPITVTPRLKWRRDRGHGGGSDVYDVELNIV